MSYAAMTLFDAIAAIDGARMYLPALQRRFVWGKPQIELLFDSIMRGYPIGSFLFWKLTKDNANNYVFYEFKKSYDERNPFNLRKEGSFTYDPITGVLDGQQRLSSIYIGLQGSHAERGYRKRASNPDAYQKTHLYLNLLSLPYRLTAAEGLEVDEQRNFEFRFLTDGLAAGPTSRPVPNAPDRREPLCWFRVGEVMRWSREPDLDHHIDRLAEACRDQRQAAAVRDARRLIRTGLGTLHRRVQTDQIVNYFEVAKEDLEDILKIFVRVNSGGTVLGKTDLLFSTIVATWDNGREKIEELQKKINAKGLRFGFGTEYLMRCCLVLSDGPVSYKVHSFRSENVQTIRDQWSAIATAIVKTVDLLVEFGFSNETLTSQNATIPVAYYLYKGGSLDANAKKGIRLYLVHALLKRLFGSSQDQLLNNLRSAMRSEVRSPDGSYPLRPTFGRFDFSCLANLSLPGGKSLKISGEDLDRFLEARKGPAAFALLQLLYPQLRYREVSFHQDHMHPAAGFGRIAAELRQSWLEWRDQVPNLQLMEGLRNQSKNDTPLETWLASLPQCEREHFLRQNYVPDGCSLAFSDFPEFFRQRRALLKTKLAEVLSLSDPTVRPADEVPEIARVDDDDVEQAVFAAPSPEGSA